MQKYKYVGCFLDFELLSQAVQAIRSMPLKNIIATPHVTFEYKPTFVDETLFGTEIAVTVIGYGIDAENEGLKVLVESKNEKIKRMIKNIPVPHITLSVSESGEAFNTRFLRFHPVDPITLLGYYNGYEESEANS